MLSNSALIAFLGFCFPLTVIAQPESPSPVPEYHPSEMVIIRYNFNSNIWPLYSNLIRECQDAATTILLVNNETEGINLRNLVTNANIPMDNIRITQIPANRMWVRDHGPLSIKTGDGKAFLNFIDYNNSGYNDQVLPVTLANHWGYQHYSLNWILDGGNYMVDSQGRLFSTTRLYTNNPSVSPANIYQALEDYMGITEIITVSPQHDDYWGHIDMQMKLLNDTTIVISSVEQGSGPNHAVLEANVQIIQSLTAPGGRPYHIVRLPKAENWKTYTNALILNKKVIVPTYNHPNDQIALAAYAGLMPEHTVVGINCNSIIGSGGAIHCITMQVHADPATFLLEIESVGNGLVLVNGEQYQEPTPVEEGTIIELEAIPSFGHLFGGWGGFLSGQENPVEITIIESTSITANFLQDNTPVESLQGELPTRVFHDFVNDFLVIESLSGKMPGVFELFGLNGSLVKSFKIENNIERINSAPLPSGLYVFRITTSGESFSGKVVIGR